MTNSEQPNRLVGQLTVEASKDDYYRPVLKVRHPNYLCTFTIRKSKDGYSFYEIVASEGVLHPNLVGKFTSELKALEHLVHHCDNHQMRRESRIKTYSERVRAAESASDSN
jgi:hypothetical protein